MSQPSANKKLSRKQRRQLSPIEIEGGRYAVENGSSISPESNSLRSADMASSARILVCSIGNPAPYVNTFHSAGHNVLSSITNLLGYNAPAKSRTYGNGILSKGSEFTLWQSPSYMNVSGPAVAAAWKQFVKDTPGHLTKLVVIHDELELPLGQVKVKNGTTSAKGHNGLKSINGVIRGDGYTRIAVGIGRPESREPDAVAAYVLRKMNGTERMKVEGCAGKVIEELRRLSIG